MDLLITIIAFSFALELLVVVHEGGHYLAAKACGVKVLRFSLGFGPVVFRTRNKAGTEFALSLLPLGGYVKMVDSRSEEDAPKTEEDRAGDFEAKPLWQRALVVFAGPFMNLVLAVVIFWGIAVFGTYDLSGRVAEPEEGTPAAAAGVRGGDCVIGLGGSDVVSFSDLSVKLMREAGSMTTISVRRGDGKTGTEIRYPLDLRASDLTRDPSKIDLPAETGLRPWIGNAVLGKLLPGMAAEKSGLKEGDEVLAIDGDPVKGPYDFLKAMDRHGSGLRIFKVKRGTDTLEIPVDVPLVKDEKSGKETPKIGVYVGGNRDIVKIKYGVLDGFSAGVSKLWDTSTLTLGMIWRMVTGEASVKNLSGPVAIADYAGRAVHYGALTFCSFLALMSVSLGILNLLPVPVLDGGYLALFLYELVMRRKPTDAVVGVLQRIGLALILGITIIAFANDISRLSGG